MNRKQKQKNSRENTPKKTVIIRRCLQILSLAAVAALTVYLCMYVYSLTKGNNLKSFEELVASLGVRGVLLMLGLQVAQVVLAVIPGEPIELAMGALYGTSWGCVMCVAGTVAGTLLVFICVKTFGRRFVESFMSSDKFARLSFLKKPARRDVLMFLLMFIPGTPKDTLTYFAPFTGISLLRFLCISATARLPSVISSTYVGSNLSKGNYLKSIIVFAVIGAVSLAGILIYNKLIEAKNGKSSEDKSSE